jgi:hypothetical protein
MESAENATGWIANAPIRCQLERNQKFLPQDFAGMDWRKFSLPCANAYFVGWVEPGETHHLPRDGFHFVQY